MLMAFLTPANLFPQATPFDTYMASVQTGEEFLFDITYTLKEIAFGSVSTVVSDTYHLCTFSSGRRDGCGDF